MVLIRVLGSFAAETGGVALPLGGPRQRGVLALLVAARGQVVSIDRLVDDLWRGEPPARAVTSLQAYVSNLRRLLEPGRPPRAPARLLVSAPPGYALRLPPEAVDAWRFEDLLNQARAVTAGDPVAARVLLAEALGLWQGPAFAEVADEPWAADETARLGELRLAARELHVAAGLYAGDVATVVPEAGRLTRDEPLREEGWRLHALALWGSGRQADALAALRRAREIFATDLGLDPGPELAALEEAILAQRVEVLRASVPMPVPMPVPVPVPGPGPGPGERPSVLPREAAPVRPSPAATAVPPRDPARDAVPGAPAPGAEPFVGRDAELSALVATAAAAGTAGPRVALVTGEAGLGKSALLGRLTERLERDGWLVATGRCPDAESAPPAWAWAEVSRGVAESVPPSGELATDLAPLLTDAAGTGGGDATEGRFRLHRAVWSWLAAVARERPLAVVLDDLHWADAQTLAMLSGVTGVRAPVLLVAAYRPDEVGGRLTEALAVLARSAPLRLPLAGLPEPAVAELVRGVCATDDATVTALAERTGGNPFYVRESARLLSSEGALVALSDVPEGVRDVLRRRFARLPEPAVAVLRLAAVAGREAEVDVLVGAADTDEDGVLAALEAGLIAGLLIEPAPGRVRFVHALVRDTLVADVSRLRATRMHGRIAAALDRAGAGDDPAGLAALAHHHGRAASAATAAKAVRYGVRAAESAEARYAHDVAVALLTDAVASFDRIPPDDRDPGERVDLLGRLLRAQVRAGAVAAARETRRRAVEFAESVHRDDLMIAAFTAWTEPTPWQPRPYGVVDRPVVVRLSRLLARPGLEPADRCRLLVAYTHELIGEADPTARAAAEEALALSAALGDPRLRASAIAALARDQNDLELPGRAELCRELTEIGIEHDLPAYRVIGLIVQANAAAATNDVPALRRLIGETLEPARAYRMAEVVGVCECALAMFAHIEGRFDEAERLYTETAGRMARHGSLHATGYLQLALAAVQASRGRVAESVPAARALLDEHGPFAADLLAAALAAAGRTEEARRARERAVAIRPDFFFALFATFRAMAVVALGERDAAAELYATLLPHRDGPPAGATSLSLALRPVAHALGELALLLGRDEEAAGHFTRSAAVAELWGAAHWAAEAREALAALQSRPARPPHR
ncbi:BTAD domain-containing putative transcriptional regulator [Streptosporangium sp. NPDC023615]|uniref:BTAD domain-containing putative transcriptional regulator n=1 Tax=Streptosporangium sp. NPDC023615 TaxID=3154794 RepID=UPI00341FDCC6